MAISETKMQIAIANYFKDECDVNTSIRQAFEKGFRIGVKKGVNMNRPQGEWIEMYRNGFGNMIYMCSKCNFHTTKSNYCPNCGAQMKGADDE